jgi:hypothetical protein
MTPKKNGTGLREVLGIYDLLVPALIKKIVEKISSSVRKYTLEGIIGAKSKMRKSLQIYCMRK